MNHISIHSDQFRTCSKPFGDVSKPFGNHPRTKGDNTPLYGNRFRLAGENKTKRGNKMGNNYIPRHDADFNTWFKNIKDYVAMKTGSPDHEWEYIPNV